MLKISKLFLVVNHKTLGKVINSFLILCLSIVKVRLRIQIQACSTVEKLH